MGDSKPALRESVHAAFRYWEPKRLLYNLILAAFTIVISFQEIAEVVYFDPSIQVLGLLMVMVSFCLIAHVCYSVVYVPDVILQRTPFSELWQRYRWMLFTGGTLFACICAAFVLYYPHPM